MIQNIKTISKTENIKDQNPNILVTFTTSHDKHTEAKGLHHLIASAVFIFKEDLELIVHYFKNIFNYKDFNRLEDLIFIRVTKNYNLEFEGRTPEGFERHREYLSRKNPMILICNYSLLSFKFCVRHDNPYTDFVTATHENFNTKADIIFLFEDLQWSEDPSRFV